MIFSSIPFLYYFLPITLLVYFIVPNKFKNIVLLFFSLFFYFYGEGKNIIWLILYVVFNYFIAILIDDNKEKKRKIFLVLGILFNALLLIYFKYTNFFINNINSLFGSNIVLNKVIMPLGISFFTFQTISYIVDVYKGDVKANRSLIELATYVTLFPKLVMGPIVRYKNVAENLKKKDISFDNISLGIERFIYGLSKKVLIANNLEGAVLALKGGEASVLSSWLIAIFYMLEIYFDFSGYSDMAIGLGKILGFHFLENFNYPYIAKSITDFWRRWHISLSSFFRDYVYIPLGGNRVSKIKWIRNIFVVWMLTGFWHGANWNFILWGLYFAIILLLEKMLYGKYLENKKIVNHLYVIFIVIISFVIFGEDNMPGIWNSLKSMFGLANLPLVNHFSLYYLKSNFVLLIAGIILSTPVWKIIKEKYNQCRIFNYLEIILLFGLLIISTAYLIDSSFNPFLYFRF